MNALQPRIEALALLIQANFPLVLGLVAAWIILMAVTLRRGGARWRPTRPVAVFAAIVSMVSSLFMVPSLTGQSFGAVAAWEDWVSLLAISLGAGLITFAFAWPAVATTFRARD